MVQTSIISNRPAKNLQSVFVLYVEDSVLRCAIKERVKGFCVIHRIIESNAFDKDLVI
jgi:hypothetical protein